MRPKSDAADAAAETDDVQTETGTQNADEGHTEIEDAFERDLHNTIGEALGSDEDDEDDEDADDEEGTGEGDEDDDADDADDDEDEDDEDEDADADEEDDEDVGADGQPRNKDGTFAEKKEGEKAADASAQQKPDAAAGEKPAEGAAAEAPKWEALSVNVDKQPVAIEEAKIARTGGHVLIAIPEAQFNRFNSRLSRGIVGERMWRQLDQGLRELKARQEAPARKSDAEIEAELVHAALKPHLHEFLDEKDMENLELKIEAAKLKAAREFESAEAARLSKAAEKPWEDQQREGIANSIAGLVRTFPELQALSREELEAIYRDEFLPVRNALVYREGDQSFANTQFMYDRLKARADQKKASATTGAPAPTQTPQGNSASTATEKSGAKPVDKAERFNRGVDAAKPRSTSVKANRDGDRPRKRNTRDDDARTRRKKQPVRSSREEDQEAEDAWRKTERSFMSAPGLDFNLDDED